jgi:hypothetical protein
MGVGMRIGKVIKVDMVSLFYPKVKMLVTMLPLGKMVIQHWPKEREDKGIQGSNHDKPITKHQRRGYIRQLVRARWVHSLALLFWGDPHLYWVPQRQGSPRLAIL